MTDDTINRQDAINAIRHIKFKTRIKCFAGIELYIDAIQEFFRRFLDEQERILKTLPSVEPEDKCGECDAWNQYKNYPRQRWIPVSEQLPNMCVPVIVSIHDDSGDSPWDYTSEGWMTPGKNWVVDNDINWDVVAWMPLPRPWKGERKS